jgi:hypothetical protein
LRQLRLILIQLSLREINLLLFGFANFELRDGDIELLLASIYIFLCKLLKDLSISGQIPDLRRGRRQGHASILVVRLSSGKTLLCCSGLRPNFSPDI